jgi:hypothetical protein
MAAVQQQQRTGSAQPLIPAFAKRLRRRKTLD